MRSKQRIWMGQPIFASKSFPKKASSVITATNFANTSRAASLNTGIVDPLHHESRFYRLNDEGSYVRQNEDADGNYRTPILPGLVPKVLTLWQDELPNPMATARAIAAMLED